jgi:hypothetical protein
MLVSYVDILGFGELVNTKTAGEISRILRVFNETTAPPNFKSDIDIPDLPEQEQVSFSDLTMTCTPLLKRGNRGSVFNQFLRLVHAQSILLIDEGVLIRGGIAAGPATKSYRKYFGPAVIRAYELEQSKPGHPRIMVDPSVMGEIEHNPFLWMHDRDDELKVAQSFLAHDEDGNAYIDYLRVALGESEDPEWVLRMHDQFIDRRLTMFAKNRSIRAKYEWLRAYHDRTVATVKTTRRKRARIVLPNDWPADSLFHLPPGISFLRHPQAPPGHRPCPAAAVP